MIDCQLYTRHLESLGAVRIAREEYLELLNKGLEADTYRGNWHTMLE